LTFFIILIKRLPVLFFVLLSIDFVYDTEFSIEFLALTPRCEGPSLGAKLTDVAHVVCRVFIERRCGGIEEFSRFCPEVLLTRTVQIINCFHRGFKIENRSVGSPQSICWWPSYIS